MTATRVLARDADPCERCDGKGEVNLAAWQEERDGEGPVDCPECGGLGYPGSIRLSIDHHADDVTGDDLAIRLEVVGEDTAIWSGFDRDEVVLALIPETHRALVRESAEEMEMTPFAWLLAAIEIGAGA